MEQIKTFLASRRATTILYVLLFFAFSYLSYGAYLRVDLSSAGALRISRTTKDLLRSLPEKATIELFVSNDLPDEAVLVARKARDFIQEYVNSSRGKVKLVILDPDHDKAAQARAGDLHIQQLNLAVSGSKKAQAQSIYFGLAISYGTKTETVNNLIGLYEQHDLEAQLTQKIFRMVKPNEKKIAFLTGHGQFNMKKEENPTSLSLFSDRMHAVYGEMMEVNTLTGDIPVEVSTLIIVQPGKLEPIERFRLDQFIMRGGNLIIAASGMDVNFSQQFMATQGAPDLGDFLKPYGIELNADMIHEGKPNHFVPLVQRGFKAPYPPWIVIHKENLSQENLASKGNNALILPYTSSIKTNPGILPPGEGAGKFKVDVIAKSTGDAWAQANFVFLDPNKMEEMMAAPKQNSGTYNLAVMVQGKFPSQYANNPPPKEAPKTWLKAAEKDSRILVIGSPYMLSNLMYMLSGMVGAIDMMAGKALLLEENFKLVLPAIDLMNGNEELLELRKKANPRIKTRLVSDGERKIYTMLAFAVPLLAILALGVWRLSRRKNLAKAA